jgi:ERCC4-type nuclease
MLATIPGVGRRRAEALLEAFGGSLRSLVLASTPVLARAPMPGAPRRLLGHEMAVAIRRALG